MAAEHGARAHAPERREQLAEPIEHRARHHAASGAGVAATGPSLRRNSRASSAICRNSWTTTDPIDSSHTWRNVKPGWRDAQIAGAANNARRDVDATSEG